MPASFRRPFLPRTRRTSVAIRNAPSALAFVALVGVSGCREQATPKPDASAASAAGSTSAAPSGARYQAPPPPDAITGGLVARKLPRITYRGGPFLEHPRVVTVTFAKDDPALVARLERFGAEITKTKWWRTVIDNYCEAGHCIGDGSGAPPVHLTDALPAEIRDTDIEQLLLRHAKAGRLGALDAASTLLLVYLPKGVSLGDSSIPRYCATDLDGGAGGDGVASFARAYHRALVVGDRKIAYAVMPRCGDEAELTGTASHELVEATTNPFPANRAFAFTTDSSLSGFTAAGLEPVDPCGLVNMNRHTTTESGFVVQRAWSNKAASQSLDPCVPALPDTKFALLVPRVPAARLAKDGASTTFEVDGSSAADIPSWSISAFDLSGQQDHQTYVDVSLDKTTMTRGGTANVTVTWRKANPQQREIVALVSTVEGRSFIWPFLVMMR